MYLCTPVGAQTGSAPSRITVLAVLIVVVGVATAIAHWPALSARAVMFDDEHHVEHPSVQNPSLGSAGRILSEVLNPSIGGYYKPLSMISLMVDRAIAGDSDDVRQFRRTSLALHLMNTALVVVLLYLLFGQPWVAALAGLLFGLHPCTVEAIPWTAERKNLLSALFSLWCLVLYVRYTQRPGWGFYSTALTMYLLALLSKPTATPVAALLLLLDYWPLKRLNKRVILEKVPFLFIGAVSAVITVVSQLQTVGVVSPSERPAVQTPLLLTHNLIFYLGKAFWPGQMTAYYPYPEQFDLSNRLLLGCLIGSVVLVVALLISWRWTPALLMGWGFFLAAIFPTIGVIGFQKAIAADRFLYLPAVGLLLTLTWLLSRVWRRSAGSPGPPLARRAMLVAVVLALAVAEARATRAYLRYWRDTETLDRYMLSLAPSCAKLHTKLGNTLREQGRLAEAVRCYHDALAIKPSVFTHHNLGLALKRQGKIQEAVQHFRIAVQTKPNYLFAHLAYNSLGGGLLDQGRTEEAIKQFRTALRLRPDYANAHIGLGLAFLQQRDLEAALRQFSKALELRSDSAAAHYNLAKVLAAQGRLDEAIEHFRRALGLDPNAPEIHHNLAIALAQRGELGKAIKHCRQALRLGPDSAEGHLNLGQLLRQQGSTDEAAQEFGAALRIEPGDVATRRALAALLGRQGRFAEAAAEYRAALEIDPNDADAHFGLACALSALGRREAAIEEFREALRIDPQHAGARQGLETLSAAPGQP